MKKIFLILSALVLVTACDWFVFDNEDSYDATISGRFIDSQTGQLVQFAHPNANKFQVIELEWDKEASQDWYVKPNGTYVNKLVFAGKYKMHTLAQNFYPVENLPFEIKKGDNVVDFTVTPFARILDPKITYEGGKIVARFKVQCSDPSKTNKVDVNLFCYTDRYVSDGYNNVSKQSSSKKSTVQADGSTVIELSIDPTVASGVQFTYKRDHYLRIGAVATGSGVNTAKVYNYSSVYKMDQDFQNITEITNWDEE